MEPTTTAGGKVNMVTLPVRGGASDVVLEDVERFSAVAATLVVRVRRAFITSCRVGSDSSSVVKPALDEKRSCGRWAILLILVVSPFLVGFIHVFNLGAIVSYRIVQKRNFIQKSVAQSATKNVNGSKSLLKRGGSHPPDSGQVKDGQ